MFEDLIDILVGPWGVAAILVVTTRTGRRALREVLKAGINMALSAQEAGSNLFRDLEDFEKDIVNEAKEEMKDDDNGHHEKSHQAHHTKHKSHASVSD